MGKKIKRIFVSICIVTGIALLAVPFYYHFHGQNETDKLIEQFEKTLEDNEDETEKSKEEGKKQTSLSEEDAALLSVEDVIGIIEIEAIDIRYPVLEGAGDSQIRYAIGHISETAGLGEKGNCVLCGHNGSRNGTFFTNLNQLSAGDNKSGLYEDYREQLITAEELCQYQKEYESRVNEIEAQITELLHRRSLYEKEFHIDEGWEETVNKYLSKRKLTKELVDAFVAEVVFYDGNIEVKLLYDDFLKELLEVAEEREVSSNG